jgi:2-keto-4-pentenoate hydratase/2-oxohepta-3-ene-1,7-dioic acid hydratase in catechol pathway
MRLVRFLEQGGGEPRLGLLEGADVLEVPGPQGARTVEDLLASGRDLVALAGYGLGVAWPLAGVRLLPPIFRPGKVICVGQNYPDHAKETGSELPAEPLIFAKFPSAITGPGDPVVLPASAPRRVDFEAELVAVIGRPGRDIAEGDAMDHVAGFMVANDVSARDWQVKKPGGQWLLGKSFDSFLPLGPALVTSDEVADITSLRVTCTVSGEVMQDDSAANMIFPIPFLIAYVSQVATLCPGDLILTGTPGGVGMSRVPPRWLSAGDVIESSVIGIGTLRNEVVQPGMER